MHIPTDSQAGGFIVLLIPEALLTGKLPIFPLPGYGSTGVSPLPSRSPCRKDAKVENTPGRRGRRRNFHTSWRIS